MLSNVIVQMLKLLITIYQKYISHHTGKNCRFIPTCSTYTMQSLAKFGVIKGGIISLWRILRCNPFSRGGYDPVPDKWYLAFKGGKK